MPRSLAPALMLLFLILPASGCTSHAYWQRQKDAIEALQKTRRPIPPLAGYRDFPGVVHVHSLLSHDSRGTMDEIIEGAKQAGLSFVVMTDHHNPRVYTQGFEGWFDNILVIRGSEIIKGCAGRTGDTCNSLLILGLKNYLDPAALTMPQIIARVKRQGGLAFVAHPNGFTDWDSQGIDGMEIYDILDDAVDHRWRFPKYFLDIEYSFRSYPEEVFSSILDRPTEALRRWDALTQQRRWAGLAGNDAHQNIRLLGRRIDSYGLSFRFVRTHVLAEGLNETELLRALASGHAYVAFDTFSDATGFAFWAGDPAFKGMQGDEIRLTTGLRLTVQSPVAGRIELIRNGTVIRQAETAQWTVPVEEAGVYRVQISLTIEGSLRPWIFSNPIYIRGDLPSSQGEREGEAPSGFAGGGGDVSPYNK
ncbi:MAG: PHP domain-containing protein [Nitrospirae bacterium]|nr:PHP domain-containing protein [Nitrospirota bacterium]